MVDPAVAHIYRDVGLDLFSVLNGGVAGDKLENLLYRVQEMRIPPALVVVEVGATDVDQGTDVNAFAMGLDLLFRTLKRQWPAAVMAFLALYPRRSRTLSDFWMAHHLRSFNEAAQDVCERLQVQFCDWTADVTLFSDFPFIDEVQFGVEEYYKFARRLHHLCVSHVY